MQQYFYELTITPSSEIDKFCDLLFSISQSAIEERDNSLILRDSEPLDDILWAVNEFSKKIGISINTNLEKKENEDWIKKYQESVKAVEIGEFFIRPEWESKKDNKIDIIINPALAFGSGHHESTSSCLIALQEQIKADNRVLDVGCGSGILAIASAKLGAVVDICDSDELAIESAKENFKLNSVNFSDAWVGSANKASKKYDIVVANIIADIIILIKDDLKNSLKNDGILILSGIITKYCSKVLENFSEFKTIENIKKGDWHTLVLKKG